MGIQRRLLLRCLAGDQIVNRAAHRGRRPQPAILRKQSGLRIAKTVVSKWATRFCGLASTISPISVFNLLRNQISPENCEDTNMGDITAVWYSLAVDIYHSSGKLFIGTRPNSLNTGQLVNKSEHCSICLRKSMVLQTRLSRPCGSHTSGYFVEGGLDGSSNTVLHVMVLTVSTSSASLKLFFQLKITLVSAHVPVKRGRMLLHQMDMVATPFFGLPSARANEW